MSVEPIVLDAPVDLATWEPMAAGLTAIVRGLTAVGTDVYVGTDADNVAGLDQADYVVKWNGSAWSALGSNTAGDNGWFRAGTSIYGLAGFGSNLFVTGSFQDANFESRADMVAWCDGSAWHPLGHNGSGTDGPLPQEGHALALVDRQLYAASRINQATRRATFSFASGEWGSRFLCKLDRKKYKPCTSPKTYKKLKRGKHVFRVKARDRAGNVDKTPMVKRFRIKRPR